MKISKAWVCFVLAVIFPLSAQSARITNETFAGGANGWMGTTVFGSGQWSFTGGTARIKFNTGFAFPDSATLSNSASASSGAFTGNYDQAGINLIGFSFLAPQIVPSGFVILEWGGSTSIYQKGFTVSTTGVWHNFAMSLSDQAKGQWTTIQGSINDFTAARQSVSFVTIRVTLNGVMFHEFLIDNIFLAGQPGISNYVFSGGSIFSMHMNELQSNLTYHVEAAPDVTGVWTFAQSFIATNRIQTVNITNSAPQQFWRTKIP